MGGKPFIIVLKHQAIEGLPAYSQEASLPTQQLTACPAFSPRTQAKPHPSLGNKSNRAAGQGPPRPGGTPSNRSLWTALPGSTPPTTAADMESPYHCEARTRRRSSSSLGQPTLKLKTGRRLQHIHCDRGGEFLNAAFLDHLKKNQVEVTFSNPGTPQQNGVAEARNKQVGRTTRTLLIRQ